LKGTIRFLNLRKRKLSPLSYWVMR
jgi:hypothetical protein